MELKNKIRFVHHNVEGEKRFTIAYHRDENNVIFSWSKVHANDEYVKSLGREMSERRLDVFRNDGEIMLTPIADGLFINHESYFGVFNVNHVLNEFTGIISDHILEKMTLMDFKHSFISAILRRIVYLEINPCEFVEE